MKQLLKLMIKVRNHWKLSIVLFLATALMLVVIAAFSDRILAWVYDGRLRRIAIAINAVDMYDLNIERDAYTVFGQTGMALDRYKVVGS